jgi:hypothetical protein
MTGLADINYEVVERLGVINKYPTGWTKELNVIAWNGGKPKLDIRDWDEEHEHMSRGITLHVNEAKVLSEKLMEYVNKGN